MLLSAAVACCAVIVPLNPSLTEAEFEQELARIELDALIIAEWAGRAALVAARQSPCALFAASQAKTSLIEVELKCIRPAIHRLPAKAAQDPWALILRTSGTTGTAKLVPVTHENLLTMASKMQRWFDLSSNDRCGCLLPTHYAQGLKTSVLVPLLLGGCVTLPAASDMRHSASWIADLQPTWFSASPTFLRALLDRLRSAKTDLSRHSLRFILSSSSHLPATTRAELEDTLKVPLLEFYGLSEAGIMAANPAPPKRRKPGTVGQPMPGELAIRGPSNDELPPNEVGEIFIRGPSVTPGYIDDEKAIAAGTDWRATGDLGFIDQDGFLTIVGRTKEIINRGGEKILPFEIETALLSHHAVAEAAAFAVPHPRLGENVAAAVVLKPGAHAIAAELTAHLFERLARHKIPQHIFFVQSMPRGNTGKVLKRELAAALADKIRAPIFPELILEFQIAEIWHRIIGHNDFGVEDDFFEIGGDSLLAAQMLLEIEALTKQPIPDAALRTAYTVRNLATAIARATPIKDELITCARTGSRTPFFYCHGDYATRGFYAVRLADLLGPDQPVFLLHPNRGAAAPQQASIEELARSYVQRMLDIQPSGSFRLGGHCNGGLLAWEIARQLAEAGRDVDMVVLIEAISFNARRPIRAAMRVFASLAEAMPERFRSQAKPIAARALWRLLQYPHWLQRIWQADGGSFTRLFQKMRSALKAEQRPSVLHVGIEDLSSFALMAQYVPPKLDTTAICLLSRHNHRMFKFSAAPWRRLARSYEYHTLEGGHITCVTTYADKLGALLADLLSRRKA